MIIYYKKIPLWINFFNQFPLVHNVNPINCPLPIYQLSITCNEHELLITSDIKLNEVRKDISCDFMDIKVNWHD